MNISSWTIRDIRVGSTKILLKIPEDFEALIETVAVEDYQADSQFPFWASLWPSALALGQYLQSHASVNNKTVLELGCGLGLAGIVAAKMGAKVIFSDFDPEALESAKQNCLLNQVEGEFAILDWRKNQLEQKFDLIIGADLCYELRMSEALRKTISMHLNVGGMGILANPGRQVSEDFMVAMNTNSKWTKELIIKAKTDQAAEDIGIWLMYHETDGMF